MWQRPCLSGLPVGGGIRTWEDFRLSFFGEGADKISINSSAINTPQLISDAADKVRSPVCRWLPLMPDAGEKTDLVECMRVLIPVWAVGEAMKADSLGAGEDFGLPKMDCDGTKAGYDNELTS